MEWPDSIVAALVDSSKSEGIARNDSYTREKTKRTKEKMLLPRTKALSYLLVLALRRVGGKFRNFQSDKTCFAPLL